MLCEFFCMLIFKKMSSNFLQIQMFLNLKKVHSLGFGRSL